MNVIRSTIIAAGCVVALGATVRAHADWLKGTTEQQLKTLSNLQPALGTVMIEYSHRMGTMYYAAKGGNWPLAAYQLKEMTEIQEVGETTRPQFATALKAFESGYLDPLKKTVEAKDFKKFQVAFNTAHQACNTCHAAQGYPFIRYELPKANPAPLSDKP